MGFLYKSLNVGIRKTVDMINITKIVNNYFVYNVMAYDNTLSLPSRLMKILYIIEFFRCRQ